MPSNLINNSNQIKLLIKLSVLCAAGIIFFPITVACWIYYNRNSNCNVTKCLLAILSSIIPLHYAVIYNMSFKAISYTANIKPIISIGGYLIFLFIISRFISVKISINKRFTGIIIMSLLILPMAITPIALLHALTNFDINYLYVEVETIIWVMSCIFLFAKLPSDGFVQLLLDASTINKPVKNN